MADKGKENGTTWENARKCLRSDKREYLTASTPDDRYILVGAKSD